MIDTVAPDCAEDLVPVEARHPVVHQHHGGTEFFDQCDGITAGLRLADHFQIWLGVQQHSKAGA